MNIDNFFKISPRFKMLPIQRFANKNTDKTFTEKRTAPFLKYKKRVWELTELVKQQIPGIEKRGFTTFHIDHKVSIYHGFKNGIPAEVISDLSNLRMLPAKENMLKGIRCEI